jgi:hypothetical protein
MNSSKFRIISRSADDRWRSRFKLLEKRKNKYDSRARLGKTYPISVMHMTRNEEISFGNIL